MAQYVHHNISASSAVLQIVHLVELEACNMALSTCRSLIPVLMAVQVDKAWMSDATSHFDHSLVYVDTSKHVFVFNLCCGSCVVFSNASSLNYFQAFSIA